MAREVKVVVKTSNVSVFVVDGYVYVCRDGNAVVERVEDSANDDNYNFENAVEFICSGTGRDIINVARYAKSHSNKFPSLIRELSGVVNADDCYCSAIIKLARPFGEQVENTIFCLFKEAVDGNKKSEECFLDMWVSLQKMNRFCGSFNDLI